DYSSNGAYFVTICVADRNALLWNRVGANCGADRNALLWNHVGANCVRPNELPLLSDIGKVVDDEIQKLNTVYENVVVDKYCIMPDHIHAMIVVLSDESGRTQSGRTQFAPTLSRIIKQFKGSITKQIGLSIWQKSFHDRIIRNEQGYREVWQYIGTNPSKWETNYFS
ncbi:MAG: transposase, partial [Clostridia bacterium]